MGEALQTHVVWKYLKLLETEGSLEVTLLRQKFEYIVLPKTVSAMVVIYSSVLWLDCMTCMALKTWKIWGKGCVDKTSLEHFV